MPYAGSELLVTVGTVAAASGAGLATCLFGLSGSECLYHLVICDE